MQRRVEELGIDQSGAYNFYRARLAKGQAFAEYEVKLVQEIVDRLADVDQIHEIGCGWGQLVFLLAAYGFEAVGFEVDVRRFAGAIALQQALEKAAPDVMLNVVLREEFFPPLDRPSGRSTLVIATNIVVSGPQVVEDQILWGLRRYKYAIIDVDRFCRKREPEERAPLIAAVEDVGMRCVGLFCDAGSDGQFHLFERVDAAA